MYPGLIKLRRHSYSILLFCLLIRNAIEMENNHGLFQSIMLPTDINRITGLFISGKISNSKENRKMEIQRLRGGGERIEKYSERLFLFFCNINHSTCTNKVQMCINQNLQEKHLYKSECFITQILARKLKRMCSVQPIIRGHEISGFFKKMTFSVFRSFLFF